MARKKSVMEEENTEQSENLTSSETLPTFEQIEQEYADLFKEDEEEKPKRGRKKKEVEEEIETGLTPEEMETWVCFPLDALFARLGKPLLKPMERKAWTQSSTALINKWFPSFRDEWGLEIGWLTIGVGIFMTRFSIDEIKELFKSDDSSFRTTGDGQDNMALKNVN